MATYKVSGVGHISVSIPRSKRFALERVSEAQLDAPVKRSASGLAFRIRTNAPYKTGDLHEGIIPSPFAERSASPGKVVYDIYMDEKMNDTFVKVSKAGKRYYYPASQEYGFRIGRARKVPGLYFMRDTSVEFYGEHIQTVSEAVDEIVEEI